MHYECEFIIILWYLTLLFHQLVYCCVRTGPPVLTHTHNQIGYFLDSMVQVLWVSQFWFSTTERSPHSVSIILMIMLHVNLPLLAMFSCSAAQWSPLAHPLQRRSQSWMTMVRKVRRLICSQSQTHVLYAKQLKIWCIASWSLNIIGKASSIV
jgi:hypothetical protein